MERQLNVSNGRSNSEENLFKKYKGLAVLIFSLSHVIIFSKSKLSAKPFTCVRGKSSFSGVSFVLFF